MASLSDIFQPSGGEGTFRMADLALDRSRLLADRAIEQGIGQRKFRTRTVPDIVNRRASQGGFFSGQTSQELGFALEDFQEQAGRVELETERGLQDILRNMTLTTLGRF